MVGAVAAWAPMPALADFGCPPTVQEAYISYLNWFDNASPGMYNDNIHIVNVGRSPMAGCVTVGSRSVYWSLGYGAETYVTMPPGTIGGPVKISLTGWLSGSGYSATQRVQYYSSFNSQPALPSYAGATVNFFNWYDNTSPGFVSDNIHILNSGTVSADVIVSVPGSVPQSVTVGSGVETYVTFPPGTIGGPVMVSSTQPVIASQRVTFKQSFNEEWANPQSKATTKSYFSWYDSASPGVAYDNIHFLNPGNTTANVTVSVSGAASQTVSVAPGFDAHVSFPGVLGGPVLVTSDQPVLPSERVQFYDSFNEVWFGDATWGSTLKWFNWYDKASPGMYNDNFHLINPGTVDATVTVTLMVPSYTPSQTVTVPAGGEGHVSLGAYIGGPVKVESTQPVLSSQRVQYYQSFNETWGYW